ncbi:EH domain-containing protein 3 isoform X2 [Balaenoptera acutorostrata]|uniref:EH domain-containing protein 3 isoform X2 n=1 Tax=Balaenoptera acutorostrata TaxID=9767 RepID=A0A384AVX9_BALAC|nr:EH domain-containing protein 3 isoform X2 [Balaenoptera acutorostrata]
MFSWLRSDDRRRKDPEVFQTVSEGLKKLYRTKLLPLEEHYRFHEFHSPALEDADFDNKPMVLLVGQYSTGKTTFIRYLLEQDFPGMRIGPEPTTDSFIAVMQGDVEGIIPGNALVVDPKKPFRKLNAFGNAFLNRFVCAQLPNPVLESISVIDTPGILSGEKQRISRDNRKLFEAEEQDLFRDIQSLPRNAALRKLNDLIKRARLAKVHAYIISSLKKEMPSVFGKDNKKKELVNNLAEIYGQIEREHQISPGDFPNLKRMQDQLQAQDFSKFQPLKSKLLEVVDDMLAHDIAQLMVLVRQEETQRPAQIVKGGAFEGTLHGPFGHGYGEGAGEGIDDAEWVVARDKPMYDEIFYTLSPVDGKITGANAKKEMVRSKLPNSVLGKIWKLADIDKDGMLDDEEFALANHLIKVKLEGHELPNELPAHLIPPSKRKATE